jgi:hypothetical protein
MTREPSGIVLDQPSAARIGRVCRGGYHAAGLDRPAETAGPAVIAYVFPRCGVLEPHAIRPENPACLAGRSSKVSG